LIAKECNERPLSPLAPLQSRTGYGQVRPLPQWIASPFSLERRSPGKRNKNKALQEDLPWHKALG
jgi:hypothetical protein